MIDTSGVLWWLGSVALGIAIVGICGWWRERLEREAERSRLTPEQNISITSPLYMEVVNEFRPGLPPFSCTTRLSPGETVIYVTLQWRTGGYETVALPISADFAANIGLLRHELIGLSEKLGVAQALSQDGENINGDVVREDHGRL